MRIRPTGKELLPTAQAMLRESIAPNIPPGEPALRDVEAALALAARLAEHDAPAARGDLDRLESARALLRGELLVRLPKACQYDARLVAKVLAVVTNQLADGATSERVELDRLAVLLDETPYDAGSGPELRDRLTSLYMRLGADIRAGRTDPGTARYAPTYAHLCVIARQAVSESNPAYLRDRASPARASKAPA